MSLQGFAQNCSYIPNQASATVTDVSGCSVVTNLMYANQTISARDKVTLNTGFSVNSVEGHKLTIMPDHSIIPTDPIVCAGTSGGPQVVNGGSRPLDNSNYIPGSIDGKVDIDQYGSATFSMPILVSPGSHGVQPQLVINYNSQTGNDILGYGFHLLGVSKISRTNKTMYYDGIGSSPQLGAVGTDALMLDGQRLISTGTSTYSPENDPYTKVSWISASNSFEVTDKDGNKSQYGKIDTQTKDGISNNSQFKVVDGSTFAWGINKKTDVFGNYIEYIYTGDATSGEYNISTINYTGNGNILPYNSIYFYYGNRTDVNTNYLNQNSDLSDLSQVMSSSLLTSITILAENKESKLYSFSYLYDGLYSKLNQIALTDEGKTYNPTIINWNSETLNDNVSTVTDDRYNTNVNYNRISTNDYLSTKFYFGDINGDGKQEMIVLSSSTLVTIYLDQIGTYKLFQPTLTNITQKGRIIDVLVADMDLDGKDEVYIHYITDGYDNLAKGYFLNGTFTFEDLFAQNKLDYYDAPSDPDYYNYYFVKIDNSSSLKLITIHYNLAGNLFTNPDPDDPNISIDALKFYDYDGDNVMEAILIRNYLSDGLKYNTLTVYKYDGTKFNPITNPFRCGESEDIYTGDFNGDGKGDILIFDGSAWQILYSQGIIDASKDLFITEHLEGAPNYGPSENGKPDPIQIKTLVGGFKDCDQKDYVCFPEKNLYLPAASIVVTDMNNDGKSDIVFAEGGYVYVYFSNGISFNKELIKSNFSSSDNTSFISQTNSSIPIKDVRIDAVDLNNDGQKEIIYGCVFGYSDRQMVEHTCEIYIPIIGTVISSTTYEYPVFTAYDYSENYKIATFNHRVIDNNKIASITDGNNIQVEFTYTPVQTNDASNLTPKIADLLYNKLLPTVTPQSLATEMLSTDLNLSVSLTDISCTFQNGYMNGYTGFLGYEKVIKSDNISGLSFEKKYSYQLYKTSSKQLVFYPQLTNMITKKNGIEISNDDYEYSYTGGILDKKIFLPYTSNAIHTDDLTGYKTTSKLENFKFGRPWTITKTTSDGWSFKSEPIYTVFSDGLTTQLQSEKVTQTNSNGGSPNTYTSTTSYTYTSPNSLLVNTVTKNGITTTIDNSKYDNYANPTDFTYTGDDGTVRTAKSGYDQYGRFKTSVTDAAGNTSYMSYRAGDGAPITQTDINGLVTSYNYSSGGGSLVTKTTYPDDNSLTKTLAWDKSGSGALYTVESNQSNGDDITDFFNAIGQKTKETNIGYSGSARQGNMITKTFSYNPDGSLYEAKAPGFDNVYTYNTNGTLLNKSNGNLLNESYEYGKSPYLVTATISDKSSSSPNNKVVTNSRTFDALGHLTGVGGTLNGSNITFDYFASGKLKDRTGAGSEDDMVYDLTTLNQTSETNSDAKTTTYKSNNFGQLHTQTDASGNVITLNYYEPDDNHDIGRLKTKQIGKDGPTDTYTYYQTPGKLGLLQKIIHDDGSCRMDFDYDNLGRLISKTVTGSNKPNDATVAYTTTYAYNMEGQLSSTTYPSYAASGHAGLTVKYYYDGTGNLQQITDASDNNIWHGVYQNDMGQWGQYSKGKNEAIITTIGYNSTNYSLSSIITGTASMTSSTSVQNLGFAFDNWGNLGNRTDGTLTEKFTYDDQNRLKSSQVTGASEYDYTYDDSKGGNIQTSTLSGTYNYTTHTHVPASISGFAGTVTGTSSPSLAAAYTFTADNKISTIDNGVVGTSSQFNDAFVYGIDGNRFQCDFTAAGTYTGSKVYVDNSEFGYFADASKNYARTIIYAPTGVVAVWQDSGTVAPAFHYIHTDHLGSWLAITDDKGTVEKNAKENEYRYSYDAWGRPRDPNTWNLLQTNTANALTSLNSFQPRFDHGYTGQEHMAGFGLINFNGRIYDPYQQMFVSPDPTVPHVDNTLSYNRYSFCMNNPLRYVDPSGFDDDPAEGSTIDGDGDGEKTDQPPPPKTEDKPLVLSKPDQNGSFSITMTSQTLGSEYITFSSNGQVDVTFFNDENVAPVISSENNSTNGDNNVYSQSTEDSPSVGYKQQVSTNEYYDITGGKHTNEVSITYTQGNGNPTIIFEGGNPTYEHKVKALTFSFSSKNVGLSVSVDYENKSWSLGISNKGFSYGSAINTDHVSTSYGYTYIPNFRGIQNVMMFGAGAETYKLIPLLQLAK